MSSELTKGAQHREAAVRGGRPSQKSPRARTPALTPWALLCLKKGALTREKNESRAARRYCTPYQIHLCDKAPLFTLRPF